MDLVSALLSALLFVAFVPGVLFRVPSNASFRTALLVHAALFAVVVSLVMRFYWHNIRGVMERFGNYGATCPNGHVVGVNQGGKPDCVPVGRATFDPASKLV
jgi:thiamine transporter ThiT